MKHYKVKLIIKSALSTPIQADTLFGHICWGIFYRKGEDELNNFLKLYDNDPPLILSNAFPEGWLPKPFLKPSIYYESDNTKEDQKNIINLKKIKKLKYVPFEYFTKENFIFSEINLKNNLNDLEKSKDNVYIQSRTRNIVNRIIGTTPENGLFESEEIWFNNNILDLYVFSNFDKDKTLEYLNIGIENGYGADVSTGKGRLEIDKFDEVNFPESGNRAMALANFVPKDDEISDLRTDYITKYGKIGGYFVFIMNPFKKPIIMCKEGSTFKLNNNKPYVGTLLSNIHSDHRIKHYAFSPIIYYNEEE